MSPSTDGAKRKKMELLLDSIRNRSNPEQTELGAILSGATEYRASVGLQSPASADTLRALIETHLLGSLGRVDQDRPHAGGELDTLVGLMVVHLRTFIDQPVRRTEPTFYERRERGVVYVLRRQGKGVQSRPVILAKWYFSFRDIVALAREGEDQVFLDYLKACGQNPKLASEFDRVFSVGDRAREGQPADIFSGAIVALGHEAVRRQNNFRLALLAGEIERIGAEGTSGLAQTQPARPEESSEPPPSSPSENRQVVDAPRSDPVDSPTQPIEQTLAPPPAPSTVHAEAPVPPAVQESPNPPADPSGLEATAPLGPPPAIQVEPAPGENSKYPVAPTPLQEILERAGRAFGLLGTVVNHNLTPAHREAALQSFSGFLDAVKQTRWLELPPMAPRHAQALLQQINPSTNQPLLVQGPDGRFALKDVEVAALFVARDVTGFDAQKMAKLWELAQVAFFNQGREPIPFLMMLFAGERLEFYDRPRDKPLPQTSVAVLHNPPRIVQYP